MRNTATILEPPLAMPAKNEQETIPWMSVEQIEEKLDRMDSTELSKAICKVRDEVAEDIVRHRHEEAADFADAQHQIVGYETTH